MSRVLSVLTIVFVAALGMQMLAPTQSSAAPQAVRARSRTKHWAPPDPSTIPPGPLGDSIRLGLQIFNDTPKYAAPYVGNKLTCSDCHIQGGTVDKGIPLVGVPGLFPMYRDREKSVVTFEQRINQCFERSENGHALPSSSPEMIALISYTQWLSQGQAIGHPFPGRGLVKLPSLMGDSGRGGQIYAKQCVLCHGADGAGKPPAFPSLWGPDSYNVGAGMNRISTMAAFVQHNMPQTNPGSLTPQQAYDVAAYVNSKPHTAFNGSNH